MFAAMRRARKSLASVVLHLRARASSRRHKAKASSGSQAPAGFSPAGAAIFGRQSRFQRIHFEFI
jgi:hypothetical protein